MSDLLTFDEAPPKGTINFGIGQPSADLLPLSIIQQASNAFLEDAHPLDLNYGPSAGDTRFTQTLAEFLTREYGAPTESGSFMVTNGNSQALDFICTVFTKPGDMVFVEEPCYFLAFQILADHGLTVVGIPIDEDGLIVEAVEEALKVHTPAFIYTIPSFHNPTGYTLSATRRSELVALSQSHDFLIVADEVYQMLGYYEDPPPAFGTMIEAGTVISLGSFSKILAPALRLGWIQTSTALMQKNLESGVVNSGGSLNHYTSHIARYAIELGLQESHLTHLRQTFRQRVEAMDAALSTFLGHTLQWMRPNGGYFFWLALPKGMDASDLHARAEDYEIGFQPGARFSSRGELKNYIRLSFSHYREDDIGKGIERLSKLITKS
ncbi:MAG: PLP-dependent aminotransferase family protein [Gammaproteobacteria bacterium]|nr:PLP-dependent aminotransferase family protein [Gammaproteobacteria bacterium]MCP4234679.1 PLP-dependent aminotransferase family protein [Aestuariibacter sp.]